jgi:catechol 2,3-dioxygenase-like lactoylglutathione lyase family enzyme
MTGAAPNRHIGLVSLLVEEYDDAIAWFVDKLGFDLAEDTPLGEGKRWVVVRPGVTGGTGLLLAKAADDEQKRHVGNQTGGRVFLFLETDDFWRDHAAMTARGVEFLEKPREESYATVAVFADLCGNKWDLLQRGR